MKENLLKYKKEFDNHGKLNEKLIEEEKKVIYEGQINEINKYHQTTDKHFKLKPLEIGFLQSLTLKDDPKFREIQKIYIKYNSQVIAQGQKVVDGMHLKTVVMDIMLKFMRLMMLAPDFTAKKIILDVSYYWFLKHLNPKMQRKSKQALTKQVRDIVLQHHLLPKSILDKELPSTKVYEDFYQYKVRARTCHSEFDAPSFQLQHYHTHKVAYIHDKIPKKQKNKQEEQKKKKLMRVQFKRPNLEQYYLPPEQQINKEQNKQNNLNLPSISVPGVQNAVPVINQDGAVPNFQNAALNNQLQLLNSMGGQPQQPQQAIPFEDDDKNQGKLDPFVKNFVLKQYEQKEKIQTENAKISNLQKYKTQYKQQLQREDEQFSDFLTDWASKKTRFKTQVSRKMQSMRTFNKTLNPLDVNLKNLDEPFHKTKINEAIRDGRAYIKGELIRQSINTQVGLSCFDRRRIKTTTSSMNKPFSAIIQQNKRKNKREDYLNQIQDIKQKFAKQKIFSSLNAMKNGLMHDEQTTEQLQKVQYPTTLLSNPFFVIKKKKKKGKKKK